MRDKLAIGIILFLCCILIASCDKGRQPYNEAETLFEQSKYSDAKSKAVEFIQTFPDSKYIPMAKTLIEKVDKVETSLKMAEQAEQKQDYENAMMYYKEILAIAPKSSKALEAVKNIEDIESMFSDLKMMTNMGLSENEIISKFGRPDRIVEFSPTEVRFIYGETRAGFIGFSNTYRITESFMVTFEKGKAVKLSKTFQGTAEYGGASGVQIKGFAKLGQYINLKMKKNNPKIKEENSWVEITWENSKYKYLAKGYNIDMIYNKDKNRFENKEISNIEA